jgi:hypothetical protein
MCRSGTEDDLEFSFFVDNNHRVYPVQIPRGNAYGGDCTVQRGNVRGLPVPGGQKLIGEVLLHACPQDVPVGRRSPRGGQGFPGGP